MLNDVIGFWKSGVIRAISGTEPAVVGNLIGDITQITAAGFLQGLWFCFAVRK